MAGYEQSYGTERVRDALGELQPEGAKEAHGKLQAVIQAQKGVRDALGELQLEGAKNAHSELQAVKGHIGSAWLTRRATAVGCEKARGELRVAIGHRKRVHGSLGELLP